MLIQHLLSLPSDAWGPEEEWGGGGGGGGGGEKMIVYKCKHTNNITLVYKCMHKFPTCI